jgi:peptidoglycan hydrolase CwlO-like protein
LKVAQLKKIAIFLQIDPNYLIGYEDDVTNQNIHKMQESVFAYKNQTNTSHYASNSKAIIKDINDCNREVEFLRDKLKSQEELINSLRSDINTKQTLIDLLASPRK